MLLPVPFVLPSRQPAWPPMRTTEILGVRVDYAGTRDLEEAIIREVDRGGKEIIAYVNVHAINLAQDDALFREFLNKASVTYCDGEGVRLGARILGTEPPPRTVLTRWIWDLGMLFQEKGIRVFLLGGRAGTVSTAAARFCERFPRLHLVGCHHGYFQKNGPENQAVLLTIKRAAPDVIFVGFGMPAQEMWIEQNFSQLHARVVIPCGGMIDYLSGEAQSAPDWMAQHGLEWLYRLVRDPARLWKRYLVGNPMFVSRVLVQRLRQGRRR